MASNDDNPPPPPGLTFEEYKKRIKMEYYKPEETNPFLSLISPFMVEDISNTLSTCVWVTPAGSEGEIEEEEGEVEELPCNDGEMYKDLFDLIEATKKAKIISPQKNLNAIEELASSSAVGHSAECPPAFPVPYDFSPSPTRSPEPAKEKKSRSRKKKSSKSPDAYTKRHSSAAHRSSKSTSRAARSSSKGRSSYRRRRSYDSRSPEDDYRERRRRHRSSESRSKSPDDIYFRKKRTYRKDSRSKSPDYHGERDKDRHRRHKDYRSKYPDDGYYRKELEERRSKSPRRSRPEDDAYYAEDLRRSHKSLRSPFDERSSSSLSPVVEDPKKKRPREDLPPRVAIKSPQPPAEDEYGALLTDYIKSRSLLEEPVEEPEASLAANVPKESLPEGRSRSIKPEPGVVDESEHSSEVNYPQEQFFQDCKVKSEVLEKKYVIPNSYFCDLCQKALNSQVTWESHINGKKHAQKVKLQTVDEIAKGSLAIPKTPAVVSEDIPRFANAPLGKKRIPSNESPRLQRTIDDMKGLPIPGLNHVQEIISPMDVDYYCELCDAPCKSSSIMPHLIGFKHQLRAVREIHPVFYERNKNRQGKQFKDELLDVLMRDERRHGRGHIKVFEEVDDPSTRPAYDLPGPSWSMPFPTVKKEEGGYEGVVEKDRWLDMSKGDFFCKLCDSHMNNVNMWEAHVRGKRHLANAKKIPGENISKMKTEKVHGAVSKLEAMIEEECPHELIVGLDFIRETRGLNGENYNCYLCGSCCTNFDILDHILLLKHRTRYLEKLLTDGKHNSIQEIDNLGIRDGNYRESLIDEECRRMIALYGRGTVEVYQTKK